MKRCPFCAEEIQERAVKCRYCGEFLDGRRPAAVAAPAMVVGLRGWGYEYRSRATLFGLPLLHVAQGVDPQTGRPRVARGIVAVGNLAVGVLALGGIACGGITFGGISLGLVALGGMALGGFAVGGLAVGALLAVGGAALSLGFAVGGLALAPYTIGSHGVDPGFMPALARWLGRLGGAAAPPEG